jgi:hypothetical protein
MIFSNSFAQVLDELSCKVRSEVNRDNNGTLSFRSVLYCAVKSWCYKLKFSNEVTSYINQWQQSETQELTEDIWSKWKTKNGYPASEFKNYILTKLINRLYIEVDNMKFVILIALVLTGVGYVLYLLRQQSEKEEHSFRNTQSVSTLSPHQDKAYQRWTLVLLLNVGQEEVIEFLRTNNRVMPSEGETLYRATQALWMGSESDFLKSELTSRFSDTGEEQEREKSEYDVHFVKIELHELDLGFYQNASQIDRLDAFRRLPENSGKAEVSSRLPSKAYENTGVYR